MYIRYYISFIITWVSSVVLAQNIKGEVYTTTNQPLESAYIYNLNSEAHAHTSENGTFLISKATIGDSLRIGLLGYESKIIVVSSKNKLRVLLEPKVFQLDELVIKEQLNAVGTISRLDLKTNPVNSSQDVLRKVPGLIIGQHAGGGKAEQIFLRGFDIDHGTDISISVDGMPVNMVSHAHGQGYSDLHFLIPETINKIDFGKGAYYASKGDFNTAGYVNFKTKDKVDKNTMSFSAGQFNTLRTVGLFDVLSGEKNKNAYVAFEYIETDGPFESPQNFNRLNVFGKYSVFTKNNSKLTLIASHFTSRWDASGQIPFREVNNGNITRFGAIDDTEGGATQRTNFNTEFNTYINDNTRLKSNVFYSNYQFELYSNFTFFLENPVNGDQIRQKEKRNIFGVNTSVNHTTYLGETELNITTGFGLRNDDIDNIELSKTRNRTETLQNIQLGNINQTNAYGFTEASFEFNKLKIVPALRVDYFKYLYNDKLQQNYTTKSEIKTIVTPKFNMYYNSKDNLQLYLKSGIGFHSNDTRVVIANEKEILPKSMGIDLGMVWKPFPKLVVNYALWYLFLEQEFVYVGDAGIVEPSGKTERYGIDFGLRYQLTKHLFFDADVTYTKAKSIEEPSNENYIPLAPGFTFTSGIALNAFKNFSGGLRIRYLDDRPANNNNSIVADGYLVADFNVNYTLKSLTFGLAIENLFDVEWNETQFATESRLQNESQSVEEIHFTPGTPFFLKAQITYNF